ncbi:MAG TPA: cytochrome c oxidase subunit I [Thermoanaerobaculia bacterium]|jgi:cytochrome c oxidase subunit 1|nr:cytochrome c oxidase subunit I [Thermoanaerobaculia bacterium]
MNAEPIDRELVPDEEAVADAAAAEDRRLLERTWKYASGLRGWFAEVDHSKIGVRYIVTALIFFALGGIEALMMRVQLARPENRFLGPDLYNQVFTTHGSTMMFLFAVPMMLGLAVYLVPLMVGTRNLAFPRLNAFSYYIYLIGGLFLYTAFFLNTGPDAGWFAYVPLSGPQFSPGKRVDVWAQMITFTEISSLAVALNLITTIFKQRAPGMSLNRIPLYVWAMLVTSFMVVFAMPAVMLSSLMLALDRLIDTHFFNPAAGGDALLWQHLFWFFGHPEVYIIFIPATGIVSSILAPFTRREVFGYMPLVLSLVATGFIGFGLWVHHMFATGLPQLGASFFTAASIMIAIPTGTQIFCWIATLWGGHLRFKTPLLYVLGFLFTFVIGGLTGVMLAAVPLNLQVHDTFFVVAHFHYVLIGGAVFPLLGGLFYWYPKITGRMLSETWGKISFGLVFVGFQVTFFPQHILGLEGMPRRVYTYLPGTGWGSLNLLSTVGAFILGLGVLVYVLNGLVSLRRGEPAGNDPWGSDTLEWSVSSPPPPYNFQFLPTVSGRSPRWLWHDQHPVITGLRSDRREFLITNLMDAEPDHRQVSPGPTLWPFILSLGVGVTFIVGIFTPWGLPIGAVPVTIALIAWFWPRGDQGHKLLKEKS